MKHEIAEWAFGFFTPLIVAGLIVGGIALIGGWFELGSKFNVDGADAWLGGFLFVGMAIIGFVAAARFIP